MAARMYAGINHPRKCAADFAPIVKRHCFFDPPHRDWIAVAMGAFDGPTETKMDLHIFVDDKGDYYDIADGLPQNER